jgi:hypothetical protein
MACPVCKSRDVRKTQEGVLFDDYVCKKDGCGHEYTAVSGRGVGRLLSFGLTTLVGIDLFDGSGEDSS